MMRYCSLEILVPISTFASVSWYYGGKWLSKEQGLQGHLDRIIVAVSHIIMLPIV
jgi:hypothetical protein